MSDQLSAIATSDGAVRLEFGTLPVNEAAMLRLQGYREPERVRPAIKKAMARAARDAESLFQPRALFRQLQAIDTGPGHLTFEGGVSLKTEAFGRYMTGASAFVLFVVTMGDALDRRVSEAIAEEDVLHALLLESAGWLGVETATKRLVLHLKEEVVGPGQRLSLRMGPGYSYKVDGSAVSWPLEQQAELFRLLRPEGLGMQLLESAAMLPKISRSGIYGIIPDLSS